MKATERAEGRAEGSDRMARLITCLIQAGRSDDVEKMAKDPEYRELLFTGPGPRDQDQRGQAPLTNC